jgi:hypothetical protein
MKKITSALLLGVLLATATGLWAQEKPAPGGMTPPKPKFGPELAKLSFLVGDFITEMSIPPNAALKKPATGKGTASIRGGLDSTFLIIDEKSANSLLGQYQAHGLLGYDRAAKQYILSMFNNFGDRPVYAGSLVGDTLVLEAKVQMPGRFFNQRVSWYREGNKLKLQVLNDMGQGFTPVLEQTYIPSTKTFKENRKK